MNLDERILVNLEKYHAGTAKAGDLAKRMGIKHSTVNSAIARLQKQGYVNWELYRQVTLTDLGKKRANHSDYHQHLITTWLVESLGVSTEKAVEESKKIATVLSCEIIDRICRKYHHPGVCPCGEEIEDCAEVECHLHK